MPKLQTMARHGIRDIRILTDGRTRFLSIDNEVMVHGVCSPTSSREIANIRNKFPGSTYKFALALLCEVKVLDRGRHIIHPLPLLM